MGASQIVVRILMYITTAVISFAIVLRTLVQWWKKGNALFYVKPRPTQPPILSDHKWGTHNYIKLKRQGIKLHYVENGDRNKPLMLCLHGFPECWFSWRHQLAEFSSKYWVVAVDMRGYGDSDKPTAVADYNKELLVEDIKELVEELGGGNKVTLVAHDWGGALAWMVVMLYPELFNRHISLNAPHFLAFDEYRRSHLSQLKKSWYMCFFQAWWLPEFILRTEDLNAFNTMYRGPKNRVDAFPDEVLEAFKYYYSRKGAFTPPINYYRCIDFSETSTNVKIVVPTLIIWGTEDMALEKGIATGATKYCEDVQLKFVDGASHWVQQEEPVYVNKLIWEYLEITT